LVSVREESVRADCSAGSFVKDEGMVTFDALVDVGQAALAVLVSARYTFSVYKNLSFRASSLAFSVVNVEFRLASDARFIVFTFIAFRVTFSASSLLQESSFRALRNTFSIEYLKGERAFIANVSTFTAFLTVSVFARSAFSFSRRVIIWAF
jgi:hypothetical protein